MPQNPFEIGKNYGFFTTGGTTANLEAISVARNLAFSSKGGDEAKYAGLPGALAARRFRGACLLAPVHSHYSLNKAADILGIGEHGLIKIPNDELGRMECANLQDAILDCFQKRLKIVAVVGVGGATETGAIDPLYRIAQICREHAIWFHVDASWGGPLLFSERYRHRLAGIEYADSVTICLHKMLRMPMGSSLALFRDAAAANSVEKSANYIIRKGSADLGRYTLEGSRAGNVLYWDAILSVLGRGGLSQLVDRCVTAAERFAGLIRRRSAFRLVLEPVSGIVNYVFLPKSIRGRGQLTAEERETISAAVVRIQEAQKAAGRSFVSRTTFGLGSSPPQAVFRAVLLNDETTERDLDAILDDQEFIGDQC